MLSEYRDYVTVYSKEIEEDGEVIWLDYCERGDVDNLVSMIEDDVNNIIKKIEEYDLKEAKQMLEALADKLY